MNKRAFLSKEVKPRDKKRLLVAIEKYKKIERRIAPYIERREFKRYSSDGKWQESSKCILENKEY